MTRKHWRLTLALVLALLAASAAVALLANYSPTQLRLPSCFFRKLTGLYCPGCGSTRALRRLLRADFIGDIIQPLRSPFHGSLSLCVKPSTTSGAASILRGAWSIDTLYSSPSYSSSWASRGICHSTSATG